MRLASSATWSTGDPNKSAKQHAPAAEQRMIPERNRQINWHNGISADFYPNFNGY
jgi:hypothetical protein